MSDQDSNEMKLLFRALLEQNGGLMRDPNILDVVLTRMMDEIELRSVSPDGASPGCTITVTLNVKTGFFDSYGVEIHLPAMAQTGLTCTILGSTVTPLDYGRSQVILNVWVPDDPGCNAAANAEIGCVAIHNDIQTIPVYVNGHFVNQKVTIPTPYYSDRLPFLFNPPLAPSIHFTANGAGDLTVVDPGNVKLAWTADHACEVRIQRISAAGEMVDQTQYSSGGNATISGERTIALLDVTTSAVLKYRATVKNISGQTTVSDVLIHWAPVTTPVVLAFTMNGATDYRMNTSSVMVLNWQVEHACEVQVKRVSASGPTVNITKNGPGGLNGSISGWEPLFGFDLLSSEDVKYRLTARNSSGLSTTRDVIVRLRGVTPQIAVVGFELVQSIQSFSLLTPVVNNSVPVVRGKDLLVRVYVDSGLRNGGHTLPKAGPNCVPNVTGRLYVRDQPGSTVRIQFDPVVNPANPAAGTKITAMPVTQIDRNNLNSSLNFRIPAAWVGSNVNLNTFSLEVEVWVNGDADGKNYQTEPLGAWHCKYLHPPVYLTSRHAMLAYVPISDAFNPANVIPAPTFDQIYQALDYAMTLFPLVSGTGFWVYPQPELQTTHDLTAGDWNNLNFPGWEDLLDDIEDLADNSGLSGDAYWAGFVPTGQPYILGGLSFVGKSPWWELSPHYSLVCIPGSDTIFTHELGHSFGFYHVNRGGAGGPFDPRLPTGIEDVAIDVRSLRLYPSNTAEVMSYEHPNWISIAGYKIVFGLLQ
jgi:hypothetical protein